MTDPAAGQLAGPDVFILIAYFVLMLGIGAYFYRYMRGLKDYFTGGNRIPWWLSGVSFYMSSFSVFAFVFYSALAYQYGMVAVTLYWVTVPATVVSVVFFATRWRRARIDSPVEYLEARYSPALRQLFAWQGIPVKIIDDGLKIVAIGTFISVGLDVDMTLSMLGAGLIMLVYTFMGGLWAVTVTDFIQFIVMAAAVIVLVPLSISEAGGMNSFLSNGPKGFFNFTHPEYGWIYVGSNLILYCLAWSSINWPLIQRYYCVPTEKDALKTGWLVVGLNVIGPPLMYVPAMAARQFLPEVTNTGQVYPMLCVHLLPVGMLGLIIAAMFSATMSMLSSDYNACAGVLTNDVYRRLIRKDASQKELVLVGRLMTLTVGLIALGVAFYLARGGGGEEQFRNMVKLFSVATAPVAIPMILGLLWGTTTNAGALSGFLIGVSVGLGLFFGCPDEVSLGEIVLKKENVLLFSTALVTLITTVVVSELAVRGEAEAARVSAFLERLKVPVGQHELDAATGETGDGISPFRIVGVSTALIGAMMLAIVPFVTERLAMVMDLVIALVLIGGGAWMAWSSGGARTGEAGS